MKTIACIGDSITYGYELESRKDSYPSVLESLLNNYKVYNFGITGIGAMDYKYTSEYRISKQLNADIVILLLGSNDSGMYDQDRFIRNYEDLIKSYTGTIYLCTPITPYYMDGSRYLNYGVDAHNLEDIVEIVKEIGNRFNLKVIDLYTFTNDKREWYTFDGIHPNKIGAYEIASKIKSELHI